jgi:hypothetical protein
LRRAARLTALAAVLVLSLAGRARAGGPGDVQIAQALYEAAAKDLAARDYVAACPKLEEAARLTPDAVGVRLTLGICYEGQGRLASASAAYALAEAGAVRAHQPDRRRQAHEKVATLEPRLARLRIVVTDEVRALPGLSIHRAGSLVGAAQWGLDLPADKGTHSVVVTTGDGRRWESSAMIDADGSHVDLRVELPSAPPPPTRAALPPRAGEPPGPAPTPLHPRRIAGIIVGAAGLGAVVAGAALGIIALDDRNQSNAPGGCDPTSHCTNAGADLRRASLRAGDWSTAMFVGGGVALAGGVVLFVTAPAPALPTASARLVVGPRGIGIAGSF